MQDGIESVAQIANQTKDKSSTVAQI
jgi:hypothetical protein